MTVIKIYSFFLVSLLLLAGCSNNNQASAPTPQVETLISQGDGNFGVVDFNTNLVKSFTFKNDASTAVALNPQVSGSDFSFVSYGCQSVESGRSCLVKVVFTANKESGVYNSQLTVGSLVIPLTAEIASVPSVSYQFYLNGVEIENSNMASLSGLNLKVINVKVKNNSPKKGSVSTLLSSSPKFNIIQNTCNNIALKPNQNCYAKIVVKGENSSTNLLTDLSFDNQTHNVAQPQETQNLASDLQPISSEVTLSDVFKEGESRVQILSIKNLGKSTGSIGNVAVPPGFTVVSNNCMSVKPGYQCLIKISYKTTDIPTGQYNNQIDLGDDASVNVTVNQVTDPNKLDKIVLTAPSDVLIGTCAQVTVSLKDNENLDFITSKESLLVSSEPLFSDANCQTVNSSLAPFEPSKVFYVKRSTPGVQNIQISFNSKSVQQSIYWYNALSVNIDKSLIITNQVATVSVTGGKPPLVYSVLNGTGSISNSGVYTPTIAGDVILKIEDSLHAVETVSVKVVNPLQIVAEKNHQMVSSNQTFSVTGGLAPFTYSIVSGGGSINTTSGVFTAGTSSGNVTVKVADSSNQSSEVTIIVATVLTVSPTSFNVITNQTKSFVGSGGVLPYVYSVTGVGTINSATGLFSAGSTAGNSVVKVTDAIGQTATANVVIATPLTITAQKINQIVNAQQTITADGGVAPYSYSVASGVGSINSGSGIYSSGNAAGSATLRVSDNSGQTADVVVNVASVLAISPSSASIIVAGTTSFSGVGGLAPYSYAVTAGGGTIHPTSGLFTASNTAGSATVRVTDSLNQTADATITVAANITIGQGTCSFSIPESVSCTVTSSGGVGSRTYSVSQGTINATTGEFKGVCVNNLGSSIVTVTDQYNNSAQLPLTYPCVYTSCNQIKQENYGSVSALYWLDFDGLNSGVAPAQFWCEQSYNTGGWMLVSANNANSSVIASGTGRNNANHQLDRPTPLGSPDPNSDYIIGSAINNAIYDQVLVVAFGGTTAIPPNTTATFPSNLQTFVSASWQLSSTGSARLVEIVPRANVTITGTLAPSAAYFILDAVKRDAGYNANSDQSTVGAAGVSNANGDPSDGTYLGHGTSEGNFEGWYYTDNGANRYNAQGYVTLVKDTYYKHPRTCAEAKTRGTLNTNGVAASGNFVIDPDGYNIGVAPYQVYCDHVGNNSTLNATGGTITYDGIYKIHTFKAVSNTTTAATFTVTQGSGAADYLVVAGGGGGGGRSGGGGGAGGLKYGTTNLTLGNVAVSVGAGGSGGLGGSTTGGNGIYGGNGANSQFGSGIVSTGGGGGAGDGSTSPGAAGGSGGGGKYGYAGGSGMVGQGNAGGSGTSQSWAAGGGGGAGTVGVNGINGKCGNGGSGFTTNISGISLTYAGGGGGGAHNPESGYLLCGRGLGGSGGGGSAGTPGGYNSGDNGADDFGGGGGGGSTIGGSGGNGGRGGSGIVIIKYQYKLQ